MLDGKEHFNLFISSPDPKGHVRYCHHLVSVVRPLTFHILIYSSETTWPVFNATFNNISVKMWRSVLFVEETGVPGENDRPVANH
jgi:hypothetical protein